MAHKPENPPDDSDEFSIPAEDYQQLFANEKKELLLEGRRTRVTTMSFHDWFIKTYKRDFKQTDKPIAEAYHAGAGDAIEDNEYLQEHSELKMNHYKARASKLADQVQILTSLLDNIAKKIDAPDNVKKLIRKILSEIY